MPRISRMTRTEIIKARMVANELIDNCAEYSQFELGDAIKKLLTEIDQLGGPVCRKCRRNKARYTSGCCGLCDMALPTRMRGNRCG